MSKCGYYSCFKGIPKCNNPSKPDYWKEWADKNMAQCCQRCRRECGGIWPSQLETIDLRAECEVVLD